MNFWSIQLFTVYKTPSNEDKDKYFIISLKNLEEKGIIGMVSWTDSDLHTYIVFWKNKPNQAQTNCLLYWENNLNFNIRP